MRSASLDILKLCFAASVVFIHAGFLTDLSPGLSFVLNNGVFRLSVPFFLMLGGYFVHPERIGPWALRLLRLYLIWMAIYAPVWLTPGMSLRDGAAMLFFGYWHLWYLPAMLAAGLMLAGLCWRWPDMPAARLYALASLCFIAGTALQYASAAGAFAGTALAEQMSSASAVRNFLFFGFPYLALGHLLRLTGMAGRLPLVGLVAGALAGALLMAVESHFGARLLHSYRGFDLFFAGWLAAPCLFMTALRIPAKIATTWLGDLAAGVYFVHILVLLAIRSAWDLSGTPTSILCLGLSLLAAAGLVLIGRRVPIL